MKYHAGHGRWFLLTFFMINNKTFLYIVNHYSKFQGMKMGSFAAADMVQIAKMVFAEHGVPKKIVSDAGTNFTSEMSSFVD